MFSEFSFDLWLLVSPLQLHGFLDTSDFFSFNRSPFDINYSLTVLIPVFRFSIAVLQFCLHNVISVRNYLPIIHCVQHIIQIHILKRDQDRTQSLVVSDLQS